MYHLCADDVRGCQKYSAPASGLSGQREALSLPTVMRVLWRVCAWVQYIFDELAVYFGNGRVNVDPRYHAQLLTLAEKPNTMDGHVIEVKGYASSAGVSLNQKLSEDRAQQRDESRSLEGACPRGRIPTLGAGEVGSDQSG